MSKVYELYHCKYQGEVVYIGQGARGRHRHCNSGCSHVYELNEIYFTKGKDVLDVYIVQEFFDKEVAEEQEVLHIQKYRPTLNKVHNDSSRRQVKAQESLALKRELLSKYREVSSKKLTNIAESKYVDLANEFYNHFGFKAITDKSFIVFSGNHYASAKLHHLRNLSCTVRTQGIVSRDKDNPYILFIQALYICCGIDLVDHLDKKPNRLERSYCLDELKMRECNE